MGWQYAFMVIKPSVAYEQWEKVVRMEVKNQLPFGFMPLECPVKIKMLAYFKGKKPDLSGAMESIGDAMEKILWMDDGQIESWDGNSRVIHDSVNPRTELEVQWGR